jgi:hypothetical protein
VGAQVSKKISVRKIFTRKLLDKLATPFWERQHLASSLLQRFAFRISEEDRQILQMFKQGNMGLFFQGPALFSKAGFQTLFSHWRLVLAFLAARVQKIILSNKDLT